MRVVLSTDIFTRSSQVDIIAIFGHGVTGPHRIQVDQESKEYRAWLAQQHAQLQDECEFAIAAGYEYEAREPSSIEVRVIAGRTSAWDKTVPEVTVSDGLQLLRRPFEVLAEDMTSDRNFLLAFATIEQQKRLNELEQAGHLRYVHGGGSRLRTQLEEKLTTMDGCALVTWVLIDSDALFPGQPGDEALRIVELCRDASVPHHCLAWRESENYLPLNALRYWAFGSPGRRTERKPILEAFAQLSKDQQRHFDMKIGFKKTPHDDNAYNNLFSGVAPALLRSLKLGFGKDIGELFDGSVAEPDLRSGGGWVEVNGAVGELVRLLR